MNKYFVITIDVEPDCTSTWKYSDPLTFNGVMDGIGEKLQPLFNKFGAVPTYLINNVVLEDAQSIRTFKNLPGKFELGTHLHAEFIEPERVYANYAGKKGEANQCFLSPSVEFEKMRNITQLFTNNFNRQPTSFRAGRFSAGRNTIKILSELGYKVDTSVTPLVSWNDRTRQSPVDYTRAPDQPYFVSDNSYPLADVQGGILEVPVSIVRDRRLFRPRNLWLRPSLYKDFKIFTKVMDRLSAAHKNEDNLVFNMMFHNVEVLPGLSPYTSTPKDCNIYMGLLETFLFYCEKNRIKPAGLSELYDFYGSTLVA